MYLSALLPSLPLPFAEAIAQLAALSFTHVDVVALQERPAEHLQVLANSGLIVACAAVGKGLPQEQTLDAADVGLRRSALEAMKQQIADGARLGATHAYIVVGTDASKEGLTRFSEACGMLADYAAGRMMRLCVEPIPGRALPSADSVLNLLDQLDHANLALLLDIGHCLISREEPADVVRQAGKRLGYVHLDDNDGHGDLHWPLLTGVLTRSQLAACLEALHEQGYAGALSLELKADNPTIALRDGKALVEQLWVGNTPAL
jgi:sugar phosphate isomerase/epimerase